MKAEAHPFKGGRRSQLKGDEMANIKQTVDFSQGTLNNLVVVNNKLQLPSVAALPFTRNSIAYKNDGTLVNTNLPRFELGKFGQAIMVEEETTNLITDRNLNNWSKLLGTFTITYSNENNYVSVPTIGGWEQIYKSFSVTSGTAYTLSLKYRVRSSYTGNVRIQILNAAPTNSNNSSSEIAYVNLSNASGDYVKISLTFTPSVSTIYISFNFGFCDDAQTIQVDLAYLQLEAKPYATSFIDGTRAAETLTIPNANVFNKSNWNLEFQFNPTYNQVVSNKTGYLWENYIDANNYYALKVGSDGKPYLEVKSNGTIYQTSTAAAPVLNVGTWYDIKIRGNDSLMAIAVNGTKISEVSYVEPVGNLPANMYIGSDHNGSNHANALFEDLRISAIARSDTEWTNTYTSGQPLPVDEWTTYKLQLFYVAAPTFTRNSIAYKSDGTQVAANLPRYEQGKFGQSILVEEGTTNLALFTTIESSWVEALGNNSFKFKAGAPRFKLYLATSTLNLQPNTDYVISYEVFIPEGATCRNVQCDLYPDVLPQFDNNNIPTGQRLKYSYIFNSSRSEMGSCQLRFFTDSQPVYPVANDIYVYNIQLEQKPYPTSYISPGTTRSPETLTIHTAGVLNPRTVECWVYFPPNGRWSMAGQDTTVFWAGSNSTGVVPNQIYADVVNQGILRLVIYDNSGNYKLIQTTSVITSGWHYLAYKWDSTGPLGIFVDGVKQTTTTSGTGTGVCSFVVRFTLGFSGYDNARQINSLIDDLRISNRARTDAEILAAYQSGQPLPVDEWTTYLLRFDDNLNYGQGGYYVSPEYDVSSVNKAARGKVYWQEDADGIQRIVYAKLDNQADWTQVTNGGLLPISAGDVLTNRKLQLKVKMLKVI